MTACPHDEELPDALYAEYAGPLPEYVQRLVGDDRFQAEDECTVRSRTCGRCGSRSRSGG